MITGAWAAGLAGANRDLVAIHERAAMIHDEAAERHAAAAKRWRHDEPELAELERRHAELQVLAAQLERDHAAWARRRGRTGDAPRRRP